MEARTNVLISGSPNAVRTPLVWAVGYYANEDYFLPELHVENMPRLKRGQKLVSKDGTVHNVRLKRSLKGEEKIGDWKWSDNPFTRQRELNGLRVHNGFDQQLGPQGREQCNLRREARRFRYFGTALCRQRFRRQLCNHRLQLDAEHIQGKPEGLPTLEVHSQKDIRVR